MDNTTIHINLKIQQCINNDYFNAMIIFIHNNNTMRTPGIQHSGSNSGCALKAGAADSAHQHCKSSCPWRHKEGLGDPPEHDLYARHGYADWRRRWRNVDQCRQDACHAHGQYIRWGRYALSGVGYSTKTQSSSACHWRHNPAYLEDWTRRIILG